MNFDELANLLFRKMNFEQHCRTGKTTVKIAFLYLFSS